MRDRRYEEEELKRCTFKPKTNWNIREERRKQASPNEVLWDDCSGDMEAASPGKKEMPSVPEWSNVKSLGPEVTSLPGRAPSSDNEIRTDVKLVSNDEFQEESGRNHTAPAVVRSNFVGSITPSIPEVSCLLVQ